MLLLGLVVARASMLEILREPFDPSPGASATPRGAGAAAGLILDCLSLLPAALLLLRRLIDPDFRLIAAWTAIPLLMLGAWAIASTLWAGDRFAAMVWGTHLFSAAIILWTAAQWCRSWMRLRLVGGVCFGLLLAMIAHSSVYLLVDVPELRRNWEQDKSRILAERGWTADSFSARQFEKRVLGAEVFGFTASPNAYASLLVLLGFIAAGALIQRLRDRDEPGWAAVLGAGLIAGAWVLWHTGARTAAGTIALGTVILGTSWMLRGFLSRHATAVYLAGVAMALAMIATIVGHGLRHGSLIHESLTFRWKYWVGSWPTFLEHPWHGVGWSNFGTPYLAHRLPEAAEEIKDPHNFIVRVFVELGIVGGVLLIAWMLVMAWQLTRPRWGVSAESEPLNSRRDSFPQGSIAGSNSGDPLRHSLRRIAGIALIGLGINLGAAIDWNSDAAFIFLEIMKHLLYACMLMIGLAAVALRSTRQASLDDRPAPWILYAMLIGLAMFFVHNLVDFSMFEPGPMGLMALIAGAAIGIRRKAPEPAAPPSRWGAALGLAAVAALTLVEAGLLAAPTAQAEAMKIQADQWLRTGKAGLAADEYRRAFDRQPLDADCLFMSARALQYAGASPARVLELLDQAVQANPMSINSLLFRAETRILAGFSPALIRADFDRALALNPMDLPTRIRYALWLERVDRGAAIEQYRRALSLDNRYDPAEPKRMTPRQREDMENRIQLLGG